MLKKVMKIKSDFENKTEKSVLKSLPQNSGFLFLISNILGVWYPVQGHPGGALKVSWHPPPQ